MPSPFPGMDPYLESPDLWPDVHAELISAIRFELGPKLEPKYVARMEQRTFLFDTDDPAEELIVVPDARVVEREPATAAAMPADGPAGGVAVAVAAAIDVTHLAPKTARQRFLEIRDRADRRVVTVIEVVSPSNKVAGSAGRTAFLAKRENVTGSAVNWLEIDLLRAGRPTISFETLPRSAYRAYADRLTPDGRRQFAWPIRLRERLPLLPIPLLPGEADVPLDLQAAVNSAYERARYGSDTNYARPPVPPLDAEDAAWADGLLRAHGLRG